MGRSGQEFGNEFRYREGRLDLSGGVAKPGRLEGDYLKVDLVQSRPGSAPVPSGPPRPPRCGRLSTRPANTPGPW
jgi:hypothetical protein